MATTGQPRNYLHSGMEVSDSSAADHHLQDGQDAFNRDNGAHTPSLDPAGALSAPRAASRSPLLSYLTPRAVSDTTESTRRPSFAKSWMSFAQGLAVGRPVHADDASAVEAGSSGAVSFSSQADGEATLRRAGLLSPRSFAPAASYSHPSPLQLHTQDDIRASTMHLSNLPMSPPTHNAAGTGKKRANSTPGPRALPVPTPALDANASADAKMRQRDSFILPVPLTDDDGVDGDGGVPPEMLASHYSDMTLSSTATTSSIDDRSSADSGFSMRSGAETPRGGPSVSAPDLLSSSPTGAGSPSGKPKHGISNLSLLLASKPGAHRGKERQTLLSPLDESGEGLPSPTYISSPGTATPRVKRSPPGSTSVSVKGRSAEGETRPLLGDIESGLTSYTEPTSSSSPPVAANPHLHHDHTPPTSFSPLRSLPTSVPTPTPSHPFRSHLHATRKRISNLHLTPPSPHALVRSVLRPVLGAVPAVLLGGLLNILDGVSYGMILFPANDTFPARVFGGLGVSMFFVTTIIAQLVYTLGGSGFPGANGSMMIEVVPFFHILATSITEHIDEHSSSTDNITAIVATTLTAFALSSLLTGMTFWFLGRLKLGVVVGFFPRHILVGCIGGVGVFLVLTGLAVCARIGDDELTFTLATLKFFILDTHTLALWVPALAFAVLLRMITHRFHHQLIFPTYFILITVGFYVVVLAARVDITALRQNGWLFDMGDSTDAKWSEFYSYYEFGAVSWSALWVTLPTQFALLFFNILHPPLNVPALAVSLNEDVDTNRELIAHGYSNVLAGLLGTVPNYLVYVNTLLFYRVGGGNRIASFLLAVATVGLLLVGTSPIGFIPVMVVGALIFVLGIDLVKEAVWDTRHRTSWSEYVTIVSIMVCMTAFDFVIGVLFGIIASCFFFVVQNSQRRSIRALHTGESAMSTVRRPSAHREYIREVAKQTAVIRLQGFLFFGTITHVEETIRTLVEAPAWARNPFRFLVLDLTLVAGVDLSSAEALVRVHRLMSARDITIVFCGFAIDGPIGKALRSVGLFDLEKVEVLGTFNEAMEWTENAYLRAWFMSQKTESQPERIALPGRSQLPFALSESLASSPRRSQIHNAATRTMIDAFDHQHFEAHDPLHTISRALSPYDQIDRHAFAPLVSYLKRVVVPEGHVLWSQGDEPDALYFIESGVLKATYDFTEYTPHLEESMVPGTLAGELSALTGLPRNATAVVERQAILWKLSTEEMRRLELDHPSLARMFTRMMLKAAKVDYDILLSALATRQ